MSLLCWGIPCAGATSAGPGGTAPADRNAPRQDLPDHLALEGRDCSQPVGLTDIRSSGTRQECQDLPEGGELASKVQKKYRLVQRAQTQRIPIRSCKATFTQTAFYCGSADHETSISDAFWFDKEYVMPARDCRRIWEEQAWDPPGYTGDHPMALNDTNFVMSRVAGHHEVQDYHVDCIGGDLDIYRLDRRLHGVVATRYYKVQLYQEWAVVDKEGRVLVEMEKLNLPPQECPARKGECHVKNLGTYYWQPPPEVPSCPFYHIRDTVGNELTSPDGDRVYVTTDGSMLRLDLKNNIPACGSLATATDFPDVYVTEDFTNRLLDRPLHATELSPIQYVNAQDKYIVSYIEKEVKRGFRHMRQERCRQAQESGMATAHSGKLAEQLAVSGGGTAVISNGRYATASGETTYVYQCRPMQVYAYATPKCYAALPIHLSEEDRERFFQSRGIPPHLRGGVKFYLEPKSRRVITHTEEVPCSAIMPAKWRLYSGNWIQVLAGKIQPASAPQLVEVNAIQMDALFQENLDFVEGGLYDPGEIAKMELAMMLGPTTTGSAVSLDLNRAQDDERYKHWGRDLPNTNAGAFFDSLPKSPLSFLDHFSWLFDILETYSQYASAILVTMMIWKIVTNIGSFFLRLFKEPVTGKALHLIAACWPALGEWLRDPLRLFRRRPKKNNDGDDTDASDIEGNEGRAVAVVCRARRGVRIPLKRLKSSGGGGDTRPTAPPEAAVSEPIQPL